MECRRIEKLIDKFLWQQGEEKEIYLSEGTGTWTPLNTLAENRIFTEQIKIYVV